MHETTSRNLAFAFLITLGLFAGVAAIDVLPPDDHEVLVLRTAQEMHDRDDWIVPFFNGLPRLNKPPLSYWSTGLVAAAAGQLDGVRPWHGRLPSVGAGIGMVILILVWGSRIYNPRAAFYAALLFTASSGFFSYVHDARPDCLYAFLCAAGYLAFVTARRSGSDVQAPLMWLMWVVYALATLAKGPQIPALLLLAAAFVQWRDGQRGGIRRLRPLTGLAIFLALTLPWWLALHLGLPHGAVAESQLSGELFLPAWRNLLDPYYFYRPLQLLLPWVALIPAGWLWALKRDDPTRQTSLDLLLLVLVAALGLSFSTQQRFFYMLPLVPAMCLVAGRGTEILLASAARGAGLLIYVQLALALVGVTWIGVVGDGRWWRLAVVVVAAVAVSLCAGRYWPRGRRPAAVIGAACAVGLAFGLYADSQAFWSTDRFYKHALAGAVQRTVGPADTLVAVGVTPAVYVYVNDRAIAEIRTPHGLASLAAAGDAPVFALLEVAAAQALANSVHLRAVAVMPPDADDRVGLYRLAAD